MDLVDDDGADALQPRIGQQPAQQDAGGHEFDPGARPCLMFTADRISDPIPHPAAVQLRQASCRGSGGNPARLGDDHPAGQIRY